MKIEDKCYVLATVSDGEIVYLTPNYRFDNNIKEALRAKNAITARYIKQDVYKYCQDDLNIIPLKITYEWQ